jgi:TonB family protein
VCYRPRCREVGIDLALREKFGRLVLLEEAEASPLGREYRAARLGPAGFDRFVSVLRYAPAVSQDAAATKRLMDEARLAARLQNAGLQRVLGIGRVDQSFYVSSELVEGRTLAVVQGRCVRESFPFTADHALMVASRAASALEYLHSKKDDAGSPLFHGLLSPRQLIVAFDGEVKLKGLGQWPALRATPHLPPDDRVWLAPEQAKGGAGDARSDVHALGLVLLSSLTLRPLDGRDPLAALAEARVTGATGESSPLPKPLADLLRRALAADGAARFPSLAEMRKAIDMLLFSGDFTPTTFDLAFFMHTLFRDDMDRESRALESERRADYGEFLVDDKPVVAAPTPAPAPSASAPAASAPPTTASDPLAVGLPAPSVAAGPAASAAPGASSPASTHAESPHPTAVDPGPPPPDPAAQAAAAREAARAKEAAAREAASRLSLGTAGAQPRGNGLWIGLVAVFLAVAAGGAWYAFGRGKAPAPAPSPAALSPEAAAAMARVKELEGRILELEKEKAAAESAAAEDARRKVEEQAAAKGRTADPQALEKAQQEARERARAEQDRKQQAELQRLADERRAEQKRIAEATPAPTAAPTPTATPPPATAAAPAAAAQPEPEPEATPVTATPGVVTAPPTSPVPGGAAETAPVVTSQVAVVAPVVVSETKPQYPPIAATLKTPGRVEISAHIDESGNVAEAKVVRASPKKLGFEESALAHVRSRKYRPATNRDGKPVAVWVSIVVDYKMR